MHGYTLMLAEAIKRAPKHKLGVRLGKACLRANVPVIQVAKDFGVSRPAVYAWFTGRSVPNLRLEEKIEQYIKRLA